MFKRGDWIEAYRGVAEVVSVEELHVEEFTLREGEKIGDLQLKMVVHKVLCGFDGKIRKRDLYDICNERLCNVLTSESEEIICRIRKSHRKDYDAFVGAQPTRALGIVHNIGYKVTDDRLESTVELLEEAIKALPKPFTHNDFCDAYKSLGLAEIGETWCGLGCNLELSMFNEGCRSRNKERLFSWVKIKTKNIETRGELNN